MQKIFLEAANSYKTAVGGGWEDAIAGYKKAVGFDQMYSVIARQPTKPANALTHLAGYAYQTYAGKKPEDQKEKAENGCLDNGKTRVNSLVACLGNITQVGAGFLYIISANSAHNWSYPLSRRAFTATNNHKKKVVVNIDNHRDYGAFHAHSANDEIECGGWGGFHLGYWSHHSNGGAVYVTLSNGKDGAGKQEWNAVYTADHGATAHTVTYPNDEDVLKLLKTYTTETAEIYFTVDRDFMTGNGTKYADIGCRYTTDNGIAFAKKWVDAIKEKGTIIGQDIIGLPTNGQTAGIESNAKQYNDAVKNVKDYIKLF
jgi:hypothetical protein